MVTIKEIMTNGSLSLGQKKDMAHEIGYFIFVKDDVIRPIRKIKVSQSKIDTLFQWANLMGYRPQITTKNIKLSYRGQFVNCFVVPGKGWACENGTEFFFIEKEVRLLPLIARIIFTESFKRLGGNFFCTKRVSGTESRQEIINGIFGIPTFHLK